MIPRLPEERSDAPILPFPGNAGQESRESVQAAGEVTSKPQLDFLWSTHRYLNDYIRFADTKAGFTIAISSSITTALFHSKVQDSFLLVAPKQWGIVAFAAVFAFLALIVSISFGAWTIRPRLSTRQSKGFIYWGSIARYGAPEAFWDALKRRPEGEMAEYLAHHVFDLSEVCKMKYASVRSAMLWAAVGATLSILVMLFK